MQPETTPLTNPRGNFCIMIFTKRRPDLTFEQYRYHYENVHVKLVNSITDEIVQNPDNNITSRKEVEPVCLRRQYLDANPNKLFRPDQTNSDAVEEMKFDCVTTLKFRDEEHGTKFVGLLLGDEKYAAMMLADEEKFLDRKLLRSCVVDEVDGF